MLYNLILLLFAGLAIVGALPGSAASVSTAETRASGSATGSPKLISIETRLSDEAVRENAALGYTIASDGAVTAKSLGANPIKGKTARKIESMLERKG